MRAHAVSIPRSSHSFAAKICGTWYYVNIARRRRKQSMREWKFDNEPRAEYMCQCETSRFSLALPLHITRHALHTKHHCPQGTPDHLRLPWFNRESETPIDRSRFPDISDRSTRANTQTAYRRTRERDQDFRRADNTGRYFTVTPCEARARVKLIQVRCELSEFIVLDISSRPPRDRPRPLVVRFPPTPPPPRPDPSSFRHTKWSLRTCTQLHLTRPRAMEVPIAKATRNGSARILRLDFTLAPADASSNAPAPIFKCSLRNSATTLALFEQNSASAK